MRKKKRLTYMWLSRSDARLIANASEHLINNWSIWSRHFVGLAGTAAKSRERLRLLALLVRDNVATWRKPGKIRLDIPDLQTLSAVQYVLTVIEGKQSARLRARAMRLLKKHGPKIPGLKYHGEREIELPPRFGGAIITAQGRRRKKRTARKRKKKKTGVRRKTSRKVSKR